MDLEIASSEFPGCCRFVVAHDFPTDREVKNHLEDELEEIRYANQNGVPYTPQNLEDAVVDALADTDSANIITLNSQQTKVAEIIVKHGFVPVFTVPSDHENGGTVTFYARGVTLVEPKMAAKKVAKKKTAKKRTRK